MIGIIPAAGYATRLKEKTKDKMPKHLIHIDNKPMIERMIHDVMKLSAIDEFFLVTNNKYVSNFEEWLETTSWKDKITVVNDRTTSNEDRLGSIGDINFVVKQYNLRDDLYILGADNYTNFNYQSLIEKFYETNKPAIGIYDLNSRVDWKNTHFIGDLVQEALHINSVASKMGQVQIDNTGKIIEFAEKASPAVSPLISTMFYVLPESTLSLISEMSLDKNERDAAGNLIARLVKDDVYTITHSGEWFDVGNMSELNQVLNIYPNK